MKRALREQSKLYLPVTVVIGAVTLFIVLIYWKTTQIEKAPHPIESLSELKSLLLWGAACLAALTAGAAYLMRRGLNRQIQSPLNGGAAGERLRRIEAIVDTSPVAIIFVDREERYAFTNRHYREHYRGEFLIGKKVIEVIGEASYRKLEPHLKKAYAGQVAVTEIKVEREDGTSFYAEAIYAPVFDERGQVDGIVAISEDITERKSAETQLRQSQERLAFALQSGRMGTWEIDLKTDRVSCSKEMIELWGIEEDCENSELHRSKLQGKVHPDDLAAMNRAINEAIRSGTIYELEYRINPRPGDERWVVSRGRCFYDVESGASDPIRFSGVVYDVTESKRREEALAKAIQSRDQFLSIASHELKTPLTSLQLQIQFRQRELQRRYPEGFSKEKLQAVFEEQNQGVRRIVRLVDDILDVTRISSGKLHLEKEEFDLCEMAADVLDRFKEVAQAQGVEIRFVPCPGIVGCWDRFRLEQVLLNLLTNALRYGDSKPIAVRVATRDGAALLSVRDEGRGITPENQARIFQRFERAVSQNEVSGLGLGLFIASEIIRAHEGRIDLQSEFGKGSEFTVVLPQSQ